MFSVPKIAIALWRVCSPGLRGLSSCQLLEEYKLFETYSHTQRERKRT